MNITASIKKVLSITTVLIIFFTAALPAIAAPSKAEIEVKIEAGFGGAARLDSKVPFRISLNNTGDIFEGEVQVVFSVEPNNASQTYAMPCNLPAGSKKELVMSIPVNTARKDVDILLVKGKKVVKKVEYRFNRLIPPQTPMIGILSEDRGLTGIVDGLQIPRTFMASNQSVAVSSQAFYKVETVIGPNYQKAEAVEINERSMPDTIDGLGGFDVILVSNFDTSLLTAEQHTALGKWMEQGGLLVIAAGPNWRKTYSGLPDGLKPFEITGESSEMGMSLFSQMTEAIVPKEAVSIAGLGSRGGKTLLSSNGKPLVISAEKGQGAEAVLAFDPMLPPMADWSGTRGVMQVLISKIYSTTSGSRISTVSTPGAQMNLDYLASNVPDGETPPFRTLLIIIGLYIIIAGPVIYLFLKWKDRRDWSWLVVPAAAMVFLAVIYVAGFKTRYTTAVMNNFSLIRLDFEKDSADIRSFIGLFNNYKGSMKVVFDPELQLEANVNQNMAYYMRSYYQPGMPNPGIKGRTVSKFTFSQPPSWEFFDTTLWEPRILTLNQSRKLEGGLIDYVTIDENRFKAVIKNTTALELEDAFFVVGNTYIPAGKLKAGEEKTIDVKFNSSSAYKGLTSYLDNKYGQPYYGGQVTSQPRDWKEKNRRRNLLDNVLRNFFAANTADSDISFYAFNRADLKYDITVNGKKPITYNTNLVYLKTGLMPDKGEQVNIPPGIIKPVLIQKDNAFYDDPLSGNVRVQASGDVNFRFSLPGGIRVNRMKLRWYTTMPPYLKYQVQPKGVQAPKTVKNKYVYSMYNVDKGKWEETGEEKVFTGNLSQYVDSTGQIEVKAQVEVDKVYPSQELLGVPDIAISGVVQ